ncbi:MAG: hypothetical protein ACOCYU_00710 [Brevefilum sp.]
MFKRWLLGSLSGMTLLFLIVACAQTTEPTELAPAKARALIEERCSECHSADLVFNAEYSREGWSDVFDEMIDRGAEVSPAEKEAMIDWLVSRDQ